MGLIDLDEIGFCGKSDKGKGKSFCEIKKKIASTSWLFVFIGFILMITSVIIIPRFLNVNIWSIIILIALFFLKFYISKKNFSGLLLGRYGILWFTWGALMLLFSIAMRWFGLVI